MRKLFLTLLCCLPMMAMAQSNIPERTKNEMAQRSAQMKPADESPTFWGTPSTWHDGCNVYKLASEGKGKYVLKQVDVDHQTGFTSNPRTWRTMQIKKGKVQVQGSSLVVEHNTIGTWDLLMFFDKKHQVHDVLIKYTGQDSRLPLELSADAHYAYDGLYHFYANEKDVKEGLVIVPEQADEKVLFGADLYSGSNLYLKKRNEPGLAYNIYEEGIQYWTKGKLTTWQIKMTQQGMKVKSDIPAGKRHFPNLGAEFELTREYAGYPGVDGIYSFGSVRPATRPILEKYPKTALRIMRWEIYARHGAPIADPAYRDYFDRQPWYENKNIHQVEMSDIELLNFSLMQTIENEKK